MQSVLRSGSRLGLRAARGITWQLQKSRALQGPGGSAHLVRQAGLRRSGHTPAGWRMSGAKEGRRVEFRTFSSGGGPGGGAGGSGGSGGGGGGGGGGKGGSGSGGLWAAYLALLERKPVTTKAVTAALLNGLGDVVAQLLFEKGQSFDWKRLGIFSFLGLAVIGPALHVWYGSLGRLITAKGTQGTILKLCCDQLAFAPIFISTIITILMTLEGHAAEVPGKLRQDLFPIVRSNWMLWVPFQFLNFRFVPGNLQVLASNVCALAWNTYMSYITHRKVPKTADA